MRFQIITIFPDLFMSTELRRGVVGAAMNAGSIRIEAINPRDFADQETVHRAVDDRPFGGGDGMVMMPEPLLKSVAHAQTQAVGQAKVVALSARGRRLNDQLVRELSYYQELVLICGRYGGMDQRALELTGAEEISIGDYVLSGGEWPAWVLIDAIGRLLPGVLGNQLSSFSESFTGRGLLEQPQWTRPRDVGGLPVPEDLLSGDHERIRKFNFELSVLVTAQERPDLLKTAKLTLKEIEQCQQRLQKMTPAETKSSGLKDSARILAALNSVKP